MGIGGLGIGDWGLGIGVVHDLQEIGMHQVIGIKDADRIVLAFQSEKPVEHPFHGKPFAFSCFTEALINDGSGVACNLRRFVRAVVRNHKNIVKLFGIIQLLQILNQLGNHLLLIMGADNQGKCAFIRILFRLSHFAEKAEPGYNKIINGKKDDDQLQRDHHHVVI